MAHTDGAGQSNATASFVAEAAPIPMSEMALTRVELRPLKVSALIAISKEMLQCADPAAERWIATEVEGAVANALDSAMLDPANSGGNSVPASIFDGVSALSGTTDPGNDLQALVGDFGGDTTRASFISRPETWAGINGAGFDLCGVRDGEVLQAPAIASRAIPEAGGSHIGLIDGSKIAFAASEAVFRTSDKGSIQMADDPSTPAQTVSLFQTESVGIGVTVYCNWKVMNPAAVSLSSGGTY